MRQTIGEEEAEGMTRIERQDHAGLTHDRGEPEACQGEEPDAHDRPEQRSHRAGAAALNQEQETQNASVTEIT